MDLTRLNGPTTIVILVAFFGSMLYVVRKIAKKQEDADAYMTAGNRVGFGISAGSMTATWIWASSMYASATSGYLYGVSGPIHYGLWGALMILFIYPFGRRIRSVAPQAHTLAEVMYARHGRSSQLMLAVSNIVGSVISLTSNLIAGGVLVALLTPFGFTQGVVAIAVGLLVYTVWSGFRASVLTDFIQVVAMLGVVIVLIPAIFFLAGFPGAFSAGAPHVTPEQGNFFSSEAFLQQGAPYIAAVLAYAIGNQTIAQRLFAVREDLIRKTFVTATLGYGGTVIGMGMFGVMALYLGMEPLEGDPNNVIPQIAATYLPTALLVGFFVLIIGSLCSTGDSDLSALSSIAMADIYGQNVAGREGADPRLMLLVGRLTMVAATAVALVLATMKLDILDLLVFVGALWGALVFPVIASFYWGKVTNTAFTTAVLAALALFIPIRFQLVGLDRGFGIVVDVLAVVGVGVIAGLMTFGFFGLRAGRTVGVLAAVVAAPFAIGALHEYHVLSASLIAYSVSTIVCVLISVLHGRSFDFDVIKQRTGNFESKDDRKEDPTSEEERRPDAHGYRDGIRGGEEQR